MKRRLEIVVETRQRLTLKKSQHAPTVLCERCAGPLILADEAVVLTGLSSRAIHRMVEDGEVHFAETPAGALLICPNSFRSGAGEASGEAMPLLLQPKTKERIQP